MSCLAAPKKKESRTLWLFRKKKADEIAFEELFAGQDLRPFREALQEADFALLRIIHRLAHVEYNFAASRGEIQTARDIAAWSNKDAAFRAVSQQETS